MANAEIRTEDRAKTVEALVSQVLRERFPGIDVSRIVVKADLDSDGDPVFRILLVLGDKASPTEVGRRMVGFVRHLRTKLAESQLDDFPLVSYVSRKEARTLLETA